MVLCVPLGVYVYLTCLTCAGYSVLLLALPYGDGHVVNGNVPLKTRPSNSFKHNLLREREKKGKWMLGENVQYDTLYLLS